MALPIRTIGSGSAPAVTILHHSHAAAKIIACPLLWHARFFVTKLNLRNGRAK
jgi:hypothetical protein